MAVAASRPTGILLMELLRRIGGVHLGLMGCCTVMMAPSLFGWACITIGLPEKRPLTDGLIDPGSWEKYEDRG